MKILRIIGSGKQEIVDSSFDHYLFVNSAVLRSKLEQLVDVVITEGMLATNAELREAKNATGLNAQQSFEMRSAKKNSLRQQNIGTLYVVTNKSEKYIRRRLECLRVTSDCLILIRKCEISKKILRLNLGYIEFNLRYMKLMFWHLIGSFGLVSIPSMYRPSTGATAVIYANTLATYRDYEIQLDGIGDSNNDAFYPDRSGDLVHGEFNNVHHLADQMIMKILTK